MQQYINIDAMHAEGQTKIYSDPVFVMIGLVVVVLCKLKFLWFLCYKNLMKNKKRRKNAKNLYIEGVFPCFFRVFRKLLCPPFCFLSFKSRLQLDGWTDDFQFHILFNSISGLFQQSLPPRGGRHFKEILMGVGCP